MTTWMRRAALALPLILALAAPAGAGGLPEVLRGPTIVLLRPELGPLTVVVSKRDLNIYDGADRLSATLVDPQRVTLGEASLDDDGIATKGGGRGDKQTALLQGEARHLGVYRLLINCDSDLTYGFETNCERYVIQGVPTLNDPGVAGQVWFPAPSGEATLRAGAMHEPGKQQMPLYDAAGNVLHTFDLTDTPNKPENLFGERSSGSYVAGELLTLPADAGTRDGLWHFDVAAMDVKLQVEGVTHWTNRAEAWFDPAAGKWLLIPYKTKLYSAPGQPVRTRFEVRNHTAAPATHQIDLRAPEGLTMRLVEPADGRLTVDPKTVGVVVVEAELAAGADAREGSVLILRDGDPDAATSSAVRLLAGEAPASRPLDMPIVLRPYEHENWLFGYHPEYVTNEVYFNPENRPFIRQRTENKYVSTGIQVLEDQGWDMHSYMDAIRAAVPNYSGMYNASGFLGCKVAFDGQGGAYTLLSLRTSDGGRPAALVFTPDSGQTFQVYTFPADAFDIEQFTGHNALDAPPPILAYRQTRPHEARFCAYHDLEIYLPRRVGDQIEMGEPTLISADCLGSCQHSGGPASTVTRDGKTHVVWGEVTDPADPGVPTYIATVDHATRRVSPKVLLAYAPPVNDVHNVPAVTMDSEGTLHVVAGSHGQPFQYSRSLAPNTSEAGFTEAIPVLTAGFVTDDSDADGLGRQTYCSLVCGPDDSLHIAYRQWRNDERHNGQTYAALSYQTKPKNGDWGPAQPLVVPPLPDYSVYYHKLTTDRAGRLYLSYSYYSIREDYREEWPDLYDHMAVLTSPDGGTTWKLAETGDFEVGVGG